MVVFMVSIPSFPTKMQQNPKPQALNPILRTRQARNKALEEKLESLLQDTRGVFEKRIPKSYILNPKAGLGFRGVRA